MENTEEKKFSYKVFWSGEEISTKYLAQFYENELDQIKTENYLLGSFSPEGKYSFSAETKKALIAIKKRVDEKNNNSYFIVSKATRNVFTFKMRIFEVDKDFLAANLYLIEVVDDERFTKPLKTFVAQYVDKNNDEFINKAKYIFNISVEGEFLEREKDENEIIIARIPKEDVLDAKTYEVISKKFVEELLKELEKCGEKGKRILAEFSKKTEVKEGETPPTFVQLKKALETIIEKNGGFEPLIKLNPEIAEIVIETNMQIEDCKHSERQLEGMSTDKEKKPEKTDDKKASASSSKGGKSASKGSGGKSSGDGGKPGAGKPGKPGKPKPGGGDKKKDKKKEDPPYKGAVAPTSIDVKVKEIDIKAIKEAVVKKPTSPSTIVKPLTKVPKVTPATKIPSAPEKTPEKEAPPVEEEFEENPFLKFTEIRIPEVGGKIRVDEREGEEIELQEVADAEDISLQEEAATVEITPAQERQEVKIDYEEIIEALTNPTIKVSENTNNRK